MKMRLIHLVSFAVMVTVNYLANALPINGKTTGELSDAYPNLFVPAGITFAVWGVIYLLLAVAVIPPLVTGRDNALNRTGWLFPLSCGLNVAWIAVWHYEQVALSVLIMGGLLVTLIRLARTASNGTDHLSRAAAGIYLGWICIATIANVTALLVHLRWDGFGLSPVLWTAVMIAAGCAIVLTTSMRLRNPFMGLVAAWAFAGIVLKRMDDYPAIAAIAGAAIVASLVLSAVVWKRRKGPANA